MHAILPAIFQELHTALTAQKLPIKPWFAHHLRLSDADFDFESCLPVDSTFVAEGRVQRGLWRAGRVARTVYQGDYFGLPAAWAGFRIWIDQSGYHRTADIYERYVVNQGSTKNVADFRTELSWPLVDAFSTKEQA